MWSFLILWALQSSSSAVDYASVPKENSSISQSCNKRSAVWVKHYSTLEAYIPEAHDPLINVHLNIIIWQNDSGTNNWQDTPAHRARLKRLIDHPTLGLNFQMYERYIAPSDPILAPEQEVHTKNIRFVLDSIYFIKNTSRSQSIGIYDKRFYLKNNGYESLLNQININITASSSPMAGAWGHAELPTRNGDVPMITTTDNPNKKSYSGKPTPEDSGYPVSIATFDGVDYYRDWSFMEHLAHELGHCLGLKHVYAGKVGMGYESCNSNHRDYMDDIFPMNSGWCETPPANCDACLQISDKIDAFGSTNDGRTNNLMNGIGGRYLSPKQLGKIHRSMALTSLSKACEGYSPSPIIIDSSQTWDFPIQLYRPIRIKKGATLTIACELKLPPEGFIKIDKGARLEVSGTISSSSNENANDWKGLKIPRRKPPHEYFKILEGGHVNFPIVAIKKASVY